MLLLTALIWGVAFIFQSIGMEHVKAFTFSGIRMLMGAAVLLPFIIFRDKKAEKRMSAEQIAEQKKLNKKTIRCGLSLGIVFFIASNLQQMAFNYSTSGKIAFITAMYMFFVPLFGLFFKKRISLLTWLCVLVGFVGMYFLCIDPKNFDGINKGDLLAFGCAVVFAIHILIVEKAAPEVDGVKLSCTQFVVAGVLSCIVMFLFEAPKISEIRSALVPMLYAGVMSCGIAYTFQIIGQKYTEATVAAILMCMESVFAVLAAALFLHELLTVREIAGCVIMFAAIIFSQLSEMSAARK